MTSPTAPARRPAFVLWALAWVAFGAPLAAAAGAVDVAVDPGADRHPISPLVYGVNFGSDAQAARLHWPLRRWGGNATSR